MPEHIPPRALGHLLAALDHLKLAQHYIKTSTAAYNHPTFGKLFDNVGTLIALTSKAHLMVGEINADDQPTEMKDVACDRTPITGEGYEAAHIGKDYFRDLPEYSTSIPTGVVIGKRWKRRIPASDNDPGWWLMGEFVAVKGRDDVADITWKRIEII